MKDKTLRLFVELDQYETEALKRCQEELAKSGHGNLSYNQIIRGCIRLYMHEIMGQDFMLGPDLRAMLGAKPLS